MGRIRTLTSIPASPKSGSTSTSMEVDAVASREHSPSAIVEEIFSVGRVATDIGRAVQRGEMPSDEQLTALNSHIASARARVETAVDAAATAGAMSGGPGNRGTLINMMTSGVMAAAVALGILQFGSQDQALAEAIAGRMDASDQRVKAAETRLEGLETNVDALRYSLGKTIEWFGVEQYKSCQRDESEAQALNWIAQALPRGRDDYKPLQVKCEQNPKLPTDMTDLQTHARRVDESRGDR